MNLSWEAQVDADVNKANKTLGIIYRTLGSTNQEVFSILCITLVRPILEYAAAVWLPYLVKGILALEKARGGTSPCAWTKAWANEI